MDDAEEVRANPAGDDLESRPLALAALFVLMGSPFVIAFTTRAVSRRSYVLLVREDGPLEWATVFFGIFAAIGFARTAYARTGLARLFPVLLALFCLFFAGEEISWGQRIFHLQPPVYFLVENAQQELNVHNLFREVLKTKYLLMALAALWAIALPLVARLPQKILKTIRGRIGINAPSLAHVGAAIVLIAILKWYPYTLTGEVAEAAFAMMLLVGSFSSSPRMLITLTIMAAVIASVVAAIRPASPQEDIDRTHDELRAIAATWRAHEDVSNCGLHRRVYSWAEEEGVTLPRLEDTNETRATYGLDPWNNAYWIRHRCRNGRERVVIYSFGADGRRDSTATRLLGDDIGIALSP